MSGPRQITFTYYSVLSKWKSGTQWIHVSTAVNPVVFCLQLIDSSVSIIKITHVRERGIKSSTKTLRVHVCNLRLKDLTDPKSGYWQTGHLLNTVVSWFQDQNDSLRWRANSQFTSKQFAWTASSSLTSESWSPRRKIYSSRTISHNFSHSSTKVTDSVDSDVAATNRSRVINEPITSIPKNNRLL